jgi:hypothetical protein
MSNDNYTNLICSRQKLIKGDMEDLPNLKKAAKNSFTEKKIDVELMCSNEDR